MKATFFAATLAAIASGVAALPAPKIVAREENQANVANQAFEANSANGFCSWRGVPYDCGGGSYSPVQQNNLCYWGYQLYPCSQIYPNNIVPDITWNGNGFTFDYGRNGNGVGTQSRVTTPWGQTITTNDGRITCQQADDGHNFNCVG